MIGVILAAGKGTRMRPITYEIPKVMLPVAGVPVFIRTVKLMRKYVVGKREKILYNCFRKPLFNDFGHKQYGLIPSKENKLWGSGGGIKRMENYIKRHSKEPFIVIYGDVLTEVNLKRMLEFHKKKGGVATLGVTYVPNPEVKGIVQTDKDNLVVGFEEKPDHPKSNLANSAVYIFEQEVLDFIPYRRFYDIGKDLIPNLIKRRRVYAYHIKEYLIDIGDFESYEKAIKRYRHGI